jgi:hypothetical protein
LIVLTVLEHLPQLDVLSASGFEIEQHVLDAQTHKVNAFLEATNGLFELTVTFLSLCREQFELVSLAGW